MQEETPKGELPTQFAHGSTKEQDKPDRAKAIKRCSEYLEDQLGDSFFPSRFALELDRAGLLSPLEEDGIIPVVDNPNPFDTRLESEQHDLWWEENPEKHRVFLEASERWSHILKNLFVGLVIGIQFGESFQTYDNTAPRRAKGFGFVTIGAPLPKKDNE